MKTINTLIVFLTCITSFGQGLNGEIGFNDTYKQTASNLVVVDEFSYFINRENRSNSFFTTCSLNKVDTLENLIWSRSIDAVQGEVTTVYEIIPSENGGVYLVGNNLPTCDVISNCTWFLQKFNPNGSLAWTQTWDDITCFYVTLSGLSLCENNELMLNYSDEIESKIYSFSSGGTILESLEIPRTKLNGLRNLTNNDKIAFQQDSIFGFDQNGDISNSIGFSSTVQGIEVFNDTLFVLTSDSIFVFDADFQEIYSLNITNYSKYSKLKVNDHKVEFLSHGINNQFIISLNHQLETLNVLAIPVKLTEGTPKDFNSSHFSTTINFALTQYTAIRHLDYSRLSTENKPGNATDIGIVDIQETQVSAVPTQGGPGVYNIKVYADVLIKNYGNKTLNDCRINHFIGPGIACGDIYYTEHFSNLNLAPNDSMWISLGLIHSEINYFSTNTITKNICVYTSHPNFKTDLNVSNDQFCKTILIGYVDVNELEAKALNVFPNPVENVLNIDSNLDYLDYTIFNMQGVLLQKGKLETKQINVRELARGMYFLTLSSANGMKEKKVQFIKE